jgi:nitrate reductase (NAD(P)H)
VHPKFPAGGVLSQYLDRLAIGDTVDVKGPVGHFVYHGNGAFSVNGKPKHTKRISMMAGGTGITPMFQVSLPPPCRWGSHANPAGATWQRAN